MYFKLTSPPLGIWSSYPNCKKISDKSPARPIAIRSELWSGSTTTANIEPNNTIKTGGRALRTKYTRERDISYKYLISNELENFTITYYSNF